MDTSHDIAIIGMAGRFPGAVDITAFWRNLLDGVESIRFFTDAELAAAGIREEVRREPRYVPARGYLDGVELFDADFFNISPAEAAVMDPQHRMALECAWHAIEDAGHDVSRINQSVGVYLSSSPDTYLLSNLLGLARGSAQVWPVRLGNTLDFVATRVSYKLDLRGPSMNIQTACSSSLVAVHVAVQALLARECDFTLAGGISIDVPSVSGYLHRPGGLASPEGHCRPFSAAADGTVRGSGAAVVALRRLDDALADRDPIYAVIRASAVNNDGAAKVGFIAPSVSGQAEVIAEALALAEIEPHTIGLVEGHGTATIMGDPIEVAALREVFGPDGHCALGSVKGNIGHLDAAAGIAGLVKAALSVHHGVVPGTPHATAPNPALDLAHSPFFISTEPQPWPMPGRRRAAVSSFGMGGTNAHVVLEQSPDIPVGGPVERDRPELLVVSARSATAVATSAQRVAEFLTTTELDLADVAHTLQKGRSAFPYRVAVVAEPDLAAAALRGAAGTIVRANADPTVVFSFPGQGAQFAGMGAGLYAREPVFAAAVDECAEILSPVLPADLRELLRSDEARLAETWLTQPAVFVTSYAMAQLWQARGVRPAAMLGHSSGELVAACLAGVFSLPDALRLVAERGRLINEAPRGSMLAVGLPESEVSRLIDPRLAMAAVNGPDRCTVAGPFDAMAEFEALCHARQIPVKPVPTSHAFHSPSMQAASVAFGQFVQAVPRHEPTVPFLSNVTGDWISAAEATDPGYWAQQLRQTVRFGQALATLVEDGPVMLLEVGPGNGLTKLAGRYLVRSRGDGAVASLPPGDERRSLLAATGRLWTHGVPIDWDACGDGKRRRIHLPGYPFERQRHWIDPPDPAAGVAGEPAGRSYTVTSHPRPPLDSTYLAAGDDIERAVVETFETLLGTVPIGVNDDLFALGVDSLVAVGAAARLAQLLDTEVPVAWLLGEGSPAAIAAAIRARTVADPSDPGLVDLLADLEGLSDDEVATLVDQLETGETR